MNNRTIRWMAAGLIISLFVLAFGLTIAKADQPVDPLDPTVAERILDATVQIRLFAPLETSGREAGQAGYVMAQGLGSVVSWQGKSVIVTHNHWGEMLKESEYAQILNAQGELLIKLENEEFSDLILYNDPGTLVLTAPANLPVSSVIVDGEMRMSVGEVITLVHQNPENPDQVNLLQARVMSLKYYKGQPVYKLALVEDGEIVSGDSGGGLWIGGKLVGNMWASYFNTIKLPFAAETSLAAPLPNCNFGASENAGSVSFEQPVTDDHPALAMAE